MGGDRGREQSEEGGGRGEGLQRPAAIRTSRKARKITSIALASRIVRLEAEDAGLRAQLALGAWRAADPAGA